MPQKSKIEWTEYSWNPVSGCTKISPGCANCYAFRMAYRLQAMGVNRYKNGFHVTIHSDLLIQPLRWKSPRVIFVNSMSDLFHESIPNDIILKIFEVMNNCPRHTFQVLTKRSKRLKEMSRSINWTHNIWMGVTVENSDYLFRIKDLQASNARIKFISYEPLLSSVSSISLEKIDWVIVGGESGPGARKMERKWVTEIRDQCIKNNIPYFFKQWGGVSKKKKGRLLDGKTWNEMPVIHIN